MFYQMAPIVVSCSIVRGRRNTAWAALFAAIVFGNPIVFAQVADDAANPPDATVANEKARGEQAAPSAAAEPGAKGEAVPPAELGEGRLIRVRLPLTGNAD